MSPRRERPNRATRWTQGATLLLLLVGAGCSARALTEVLTRRAPLALVLGGGFGPLAGALAVAALLVVWALVAEVRELKAGRPPRGLAPLRFAFAVCVLGWLVLTGLVQPFQMLWFEVALALAAGLFGALLLVRRAVHDEETDHRLRRLLRAADLVVFSLACLAVGGELVLSGLAAVHPSPLLARSSDAPRRLVERFRPEPGSLRFGFPLNSAGANDVEFLQRAPDRRLVVCIGDSFSLGAVPHALHYTTVAEGLADVDVHNFGVPGIGPPEYLHLLVEEALPLDPSLVLFALFVGNDLVVPEVEADLPHAGLRRLFARDGVLLFVLPRRLARLADERRRVQDAGVATVQGADADAAGLTGEALDAAFPWFADPGLEEPTLSAEAHLRLERRRAREVCRLEAADLEPLMERLRAARAAAAPVPFGVVLVPDEFQVEDGLWEQVVAAGDGDGGGAGVASLDRDRPQRLLAALLEAEGIPVLDLLPTLRAEPPGEDGRRHLYHLQDTHWNARGNAAAGHALAVWVARLLPRP